MNGLPTRYVFTCEKCKKVAPPRTIRAAQGSCACKGQTWSIEVEFEGGASDNMRLAANALGIAGAVTLGIGFSAGRGDAAGDERVFLQNVSDLEMNIICQESSQVPVRLVHLILAKQQEDLQRNRRRMQSRGARECRVCGVLVVPVKEKPWTMDGTCSKACCVRANGVSSYADIEPKLLQLIEADNDPLQTKSLKNGKIPIKCGCGETMLVPRMYAGTMRPCPHCGAKVHVDW